MVWGVRGCCPVANSKGLNTEQHPTAPVFLVGLHLSALSRPRGVRLFYPSELSKIYRPHVSYLPLDTYCRLLTLPTIKYRVFIIRNNPIFETSCIALP
ncbi:hypothetical protein HN51_045440 [Arachis hypogaea]